MSEIQPTQDRTILARIFFSPDEQRLRAGWRLLIQTLLLLVLAMIIGSVGILIGNFLPKSLTVIWDQIIEFLIFTSSIYIARRWLDKRSFESLGLKLDRQTLIDILTGVGISFVQMGFIYILMTGLGWLTFQGFAWQFDPIPVVLTGAITFLIAFMFGAWNEEILSRGYHLQTIASGTNLFWGVVISSSIFGLIHIFNPGATWVSTAGIFFAGVYLAYAYLRTKQLWLSMGLHMGWNFFEGVVFGFPVSGLNVYHLTRIVVQGPASWTGGVFGPEAGLIVLPSLLLGGFLIYLYTRKRAN